MAATFIPGTGDFTSGDEPKIAAALRKLAEKLGTNIYGISGARTPAHSVAVGGFPNDPHTRGEAADIGFGNQLRVSAAQISDADLASVGLYRPFPGAQEINHVQLKAGGATPSGGVGSTGNGADKAAASVDTSKGGGGIAGAVGDAASGVAGAAASVVKSPVQAFVDAIGHAGARLLLEVALILGGAILALWGVTRLAGTSPKRLATGVAKTALPEARMAAA